MAINAGDIVHITYRKTPEVIRHISLIIPEGWNKRNDLANHLNKEGSSTHGWFAKEALMAVGAKYHNAIDQHTGTLIPAKISIDAQSGLVSRMGYHKNGQRQDPENTDMVALMTFGNRFNIKTIGDAVSGLLKTGEWAMDNSGTLRAAYSYEAGVEQFKVTGEALDDLQAATAATVEEIRSTLQNSYNPDERVNIIQGRLIAA